jgi:hypothetical protein
VPDAGRQMGRVRRKRRRGVERGVVRDEDVTMRALSEALRVTPSLFAP